MRIEIRELVIRARVEPPSSAPAAPASAGAGDERRELVAECVEQVLEILRQREER